MAKKKKQYKSYQDYLNSQEWKGLKEKFLKKHSGLNNVCEISLTPIKGDREFHHWKYPKDWNNDSIDNIIMVRKFVHEMAHESKINFPKKNLTREIAIQILQRRYNSSFKTYPLLSKINILKEKLSIAKENAVNTCIALKED